MNDHNKVFIKLTTKWTSQWRCYIAIFDNITPPTECDNQYITLNNQIESYKQILHTENTAGKGRSWFAFVVKHIYKRVPRKKHDDNDNNNNNEPHFVKEAQVESKDGLGKPGHLWEVLLISKVKQSATALGLHTQRKKNTSKPNTTMTLHLQI